MNSVLSSKLKNLLQSSGLKYTTSRKKILEYLVAEHRPVSALEIIENFKSSMINKVTIYRTLDSFVENNIVHQVEHINDHRLYEVHIHDDCEVNHPHFSCNTCEKVTCLEKNGQLQIISAVLPKSYLVEHIRLHIKGVCPDCSNSLLV